MEARGGYSFQNPGVRAKAQAAILEKFGVDNVGRLPSTKHKIRQTNQERYGVDNPFEAEEVKQRIQATMLARHGATNPSQVAEFQAKKVQTCQGRYGVDNPQQDPEIRRKTESTNLERYGGKAPLCHPAVRRKVAATTAKHFGFPRAMQNARHFQWSSRRSYKRVLFTLPSGKILSLQGREDVALRDLLRSGLREEDFDFDLSTLPPIFYVDTDGVRRRYYPDFFIPRLGLVLDVKCLYTLKVSWARNLAKREATRSHGLTFRFLVR